MPKRSSSGRVAEQPAAASAPGDPGAGLPATQVGKDPAAVALGRKGGVKGGPARAARLSPERRREIAQHAAARRWAARGPQDA